MKDSCCFWVLLFKVFSMISSLPLIISERLLKREFFLIGSLKGSFPMESRLVPLETELVYSFLELYSDRWLRVSELSFLDSDYVFLSVFTFFSLRACRYFFYFLISFLCLNKRVYFVDAILTYSSSIFFFSYSLSLCCNTSEELLLRNSFFVSTIIFQSRTLNAGLWIFFFTWFSMWFFN